MKRNRWGIALAAVGIHISIGSVYAWSVLTRPVMAAMGLSLAETTWAFSIAILFLGLSAGFLGRWTERMGPRRSGLLSMVLYTAALLGTAFAIHVRSAALLYLFYGVIGGAGLGIGYITPVATLVKWFPERRGFATGLAIMGFGFASLMAGPLMAGLSAVCGLVMNFVIMAVLYSLIMTASALYLVPPEETREIAGTPVELLLKGPQMTRREALRTGTFYVLWLLFFINITCGIALLAVISPMAQERIGMDAASAAALVGLAGVMNGLGRIGWSALSDRIGRSRVYILFFLLEAAAFWLLSETSSPLLFQFLVCLIVTCYGGGFSCMPAYLADRFGIRELSSIHGAILTAWGMAGLAGPLFLSFMKEVTGGYDATLLVFALLFLPALAGAAWLMKKETA